VPKRHIVLETNREYYLPKAPRNDESGGSGYRLYLHLLLSLFKLLADPGVFWFLIFFLRTHHRLRRSQTLLPHAKKAE
jgi:hypothetical protein